MISQHLLLENPTIMIICAGNAQLDTSDEISFISFNNRKEANDALQVFNAQNLYNARAVALFKDY